MHTWLRRSGSSPSCDFYQVLLPQQSQDAQTMKNHSPEANAAGSGITLVPIFRTASSVSLRSLHLPLSYPRNMRLMAALINNPRWFAECQPRQHTHSADGLKRPGRYKILLWHSIIVGRWRRKSSFSDMTVTVWDALANEVRKGLSGMSHGRPFESLQSRMNCCMSCQAVQNPQ